MIYAFWFRDLVSLSKFSKYFPIPENILLVLENTGKFIDFNIFHHYYYEV